MPDPANDRIWHMAADHSLIADGRFRGEADMHARVASISSIRSAEEVAQFGRGLFGKFPLERNDRHRPARR
jgi:hypothetical protein